MGDGPRRLVPDPGRGDGPVLHQVGPVVNGTDAEAREQLDRALEVARQGLHVFPVDYPNTRYCRGIKTKQHNPQKCDDRGKHPTCRWSEWSTDDVELLAEPRYFGGREPRNIGVDCGKSNLLVLDDDGELTRACGDLGITLPATMRVRTADGQHHYYRPPAGFDLGNAEGALRPYNVNVRGRGGYVVGAGSLHETGVIYEVVSGAVGVAGLPSDVIAALQQKSSTGSDGTGGDHWWADGPITKGNRHAAIVAIAGWHRRMGHTIAEAMPALRDLFSRLEGDRYTLDDVIAKAEDVYARYEAGYRGDEQDPYSYNRKGRAGDRTLVVTRASEIPMRATRWLWASKTLWAGVVTVRQWLPLGGLCLLGGRESTGKTTWGYRIAAQVTNGELPGCFEGEPRSVVVCATEDDWSHTIVPRLAAADADLDRVLRVDARDRDVTTGLTLPADIGQLQRVCGEHHVALVLLDPLMGTIDTELDSHKDHEVRRALEPLSRFAHAAQVCIVGLIHVNKTVGTDLLTRIMASRAFSAVARSVLFAARTESDERSTADRFLIGQAKNNLAARTGVTLVYHMEGRRVGYDAEVGEDIWSPVILVDETRHEHIDEVVAAQEARKPARETAVDRCEAWLERYLSGKGEVHSAQVKKAAKTEGFKVGTLQRAREGLGVRSVSIKDTTRTAWVLDEDADPGEPVE